MEKIFDTIILGGGPAGMSAGVYCARGNINCAIIDTSLLGGQPTNYLEIENYLGFPSIEGWELSEKFEQHLDKFNVEKFTMEEIQSVDLISDPKVITTLKGVYKAHSIIIATGAKSTKLGVRGENEFVGKGVSYCAVCDGAFYKDKTVVVVGGGNAAVEEGCYLTKFAKKVYIVHRRDSLRADKIVQQRAFNNDKVEFIWDSVVEEIKGENKVEKVVIKNVKTNKTQELETDGVFPYIGFSPNCESFNGQLKQDNRGFIVVDENMQSSIPGVFAIGDVRVTPLRQVITAVADGAVAGVSAIKYVEEVSKQKVEA